MYNQRYQSQFQSHQVLPLINSLSVNNSMKNMLAQLYNVPQQRTSFPQINPPQPYGEQIIQQNFDYPYNINRGLSQNFRNVGPYQLIQGTPQGQYLQLGNPQQASIPINFDLSAFGIPNQTIAQKPIKYKKARFYQQKPEVAEFPADFLEKIPLPTIQRAYANQIEPQVIYVPVDGGSQQQEPKPKRKKGKKKKQVQETVEDQDYDREVDEKELASLKKRESVKKDTLNNSKRAKTQLISQQGDTSNLQRYTQVEEAPKRSWREATRSFRRNLIFIALYLQTLKQNIQAKKYLQANLINNISAEAFDACTNWIDDSLEQPLLELLNLREDLSIEISKDSSRQKEKTSSFIIKCLEQILKGYKPASLGNEFFQFINQISAAYKFPPQQYYLNFEHERILFTSFGSLGKLTELQSKMSIMMFVIIRAFVFTTLMKAWQYHPNQDNHQHLFLVQRNSIILSSIVHDLVVNYTIEKIQPTNQNFEDIKGDDLVQPRPVPLTDDTQEYINQGKRGKNEVLVDNILAASMTARYYMNKSTKKPEKWAGKIMDLIIQITDKVYDSAQEVLKEEKEQIPKERMLVKMFYIDQTIKKNRFKKVKK